MERNRRTVNTEAPPRRRYDSSRRREQAERTRREILDAARARFLDAGYAATTVAAIAGDVGVSVDTIYKAFGGKTGVLRAICQAALEGAGPVPARTRSDALQANERDPYLIVRGFGALSAEVSPRVSPLLLLLRDAAVGDAEAAELRADLERQRLERMTANARNLHRAGHLRPGLGVKEAAQIMWTYASPELYELLIVRQGWTPERLGTFVGDALVAALLPPERPRPK